MRPLCIYHSPCADGFGAAWAVRHLLKGDVDFHPGSYGDPPPDVKGRDVIIVDFSYKKDVLHSLLVSGDVNQAMSILILDHHKSAKEDLAGLKSPLFHRGYVPNEWRMEWEQQSEWPVRAVFDMQRSGAGLAWDFFSGGKRRPPLLDHIEDRDLWLFRLQGTREIQAAVFSYPYKFEVWDTLMATDPQKLFDEGVALERKHFKDISELLKQSTRMMKIGGVFVPVANLPYTMSSDAGHMLLQQRPDAPFAACYFDTAKGRTFSLRSDDARTDVSYVAAEYGGGGHRNAAGFKMPIGWEGDPL